MLRMGLETQQLDAQAVDHLDAQLLTHLTCSGNLRILRKAPTGAENPLCSKGIPFKLGDILGPCSVSGGQMEPGHCRITNCSKSEPFRASNSCSVGFCPPPLAKISGWSTLSVSATDSSSSMASTAASTPGCPTASYPNSSLKVSHGFTILQYISSS